MRRTAMLVVLVATVTGCEHATEPRLEPQLDVSPASTPVVCPGNMAVVDGALAGSSFQVVLGRYNVQEEWRFHGSPLNCSTNLQSSIRGVDGKSVSAYHAFPFASLQVYHWSEGSPISTSNDSYISVWCDGCFEEVVLFTSPAPDTGFIDVHYTARAYSFEGVAMPASMWTVTPAVCTLDSRTSPASVTFHSAGECTIWAHYGNYNGDHYAQQTFQVMKPLAAKLDEGTKVVITPSNPDDPDELGAVTLVFDTVTTEGTVTVTSTMEWPEDQADPPGNFSLGQPPTYYDITTAGVVFNGLVQVCLTYDPLHFFGGSPFVLLHYDPSLGVWEPLQDQTQPSSNTVCGWTSSFSYFAVVQQLAGTSDEGDGKAKGKAKGKGKGG
jgi:hypothetical protein